MPRLQWQNLPREKWQHLRDRAKERLISQEDLFALAEWKAEDPDVPDGDWYKDFGTFKLCGRGRFPSTFPWLVRWRKENACRLPGRRHHPSCQNLHQLPGRPTGGGVAEAEVSHVGEEIVMEA